MEIGDYCYYKNGGDEGVVQIKAIDGNVDWPAGPFSAYTVITVTPILDAAGATKVQKAQEMPALGFDKLTLLA